jgi:hypothetical protein
MGPKDLTPSQVSKALRRWGEHGVDHRNPDHIAAYLLLRTTNDRPRPEQLLQILATKVNQVAKAASMTCTFLLVPKRNFGVAGLPSDLEQFVVPEKELRQDFEVPTDTDLSAVFVLDGGAPTAKLGRGVRKLTFSDTLSRSLTASAASSSSAAPAPAPAAAEPMPKLAETEAAPDPEPEDSPVKVASAPAEPTARAAAQAPVASDDPGSSTAPDSKRRRLLKTMGSDEATAEEKEISSWEHLIAKVRSAARAGQLYNPDPSCSSTVHFWASQVVAALKTTQSNGQVKLVSAMAKTFPTFLLKATR